MEKPTICSKCFHRSNVTGMCCSTKSEFYSLVVNSNYSTMEGFSPIYVCDYLMPIPTTYNPRLRGIDMSDLTKYSPEDPFVTLVEDPEGEWVEWDDVKTELARWKRIANIIDKAHDEVEKENSNLEEALKLLEGVLKPFAEIWEQFEKMNQSTTNNSVLSAPAILFQLARNALRDQEAPCAVEHENCDCPASDPEREDLDEKWRAIRNRGTYLKKV